jgi:hypothetical protein
VKGPNAQAGNTTPGYLATAGTAVLPGSGITQQEMGLQRAGDANNDDVVSAQDFTILKATFGRSVGQSGYDGRADFNLDTIVSAIDFSLLKNDFGLGGVGPLGPDNPDRSIGPTQSGAQAQAPAPGAQGHTNHLWVHGAAAGQ